MLNKHSLNLTFDGFEVSQALSPHCLIGKYGLSVSMCLQPSGYSTSTIQHFIVHIIYCSFSRKQIIYYTDLYGHGKVEAKTAWGTLGNLPMSRKWLFEELLYPDWASWSQRFTKKWCRISNMVTQKWILNGGYVSIPPLSPTSWQPQIGKMMFFFTTRWPLLGNAQGIGSPCGVAHH